MPARRAFRPVSNTTATADVAAQIREAVLAETLRPGDRLPSEQKLAEEFEVSRSVVREALKELKGAGLIEVGRRGRDGGPVVTAFASGELAEMLGTHLRLLAVSVPSLVEFRALVESAAARWAADRRAPEHMERMRDLVERMERPGLSWNGYHDLDVAFHLAVTESSENAVAAVVMSGIREAMRRAMLEGFRRSDDAAALRGDMVRQHREIQQAIVAGRSRDAEELVRRHILGFYGRLFPLP